MNGQQVADMATAVNQSATDIVVREIIADLRKRVADLRPAYFQEHPRARYVSESTEGATWALRTTAERLCEQYIGHAWEETVKEWRYECSICGARKRVED